MIDKVDFIRKLGSADSCDELAKIAGDFLQWQAALENFMILKHEQHPDPFRVIYYCGLFSDQENPAEFFIDFDSDAQPFTGHKHRSYFYYLLDRDYCSKDGYIVISKDELSTEVVNLIKTWDAFERGINRACTRSLENSQIEFTNISSQLLHDVDSLINTAGTNHASDAFADKKVYQEKANHNLLFFLREPELITSTIPLKDFVNASLDLLNIDPVHVKLTIPAKPSDITIDVELFSRAFNEIIKNAMQANADDASKMAIKIEPIESRSPFCKNQWLKIAVEDSGQGIKEDFLPLVFLPFFTTTKESGSTGFGLPIAKKIVEAHKGHLELISEQGCGTQVIIYLPLISHG